MRRLVIAAVLSCAVLPAVAAPAHASASPEPARVMIACDLVPGVPAVNDVVTTVIGTLPRAVQVAYEFVAEVVCAL